MKYLDEYRDDRIAKKVVDEIRRTVTRPWVIMEVCGGQTHSIVKYGIDYLLPPEIELVHGPGCPVCVTPLDMIDRAHAIARRPDVIFCSFGDMLRVPGSEGDLFQVRAAGGSVRIVYSPMDCLNIAQQNPEKQVVFFAIGFETTAPANAMAVSRAKALGLRNFSLLVSHVVVPPSMTGILQSPGNRVQGFLGPGHVCAVMGWSEYEPIAARYGTPIVITGFEPVDLLEGILLTVRQLEQGRAEVENQYPRAVSREGNVAARRMIAEVFDVADRSWRGIGIIPKSGYKLGYAFREYDADRIFEVQHIRTREPEICISGQVLRGLKKPVDCPAFGAQCSPQTPLGATMVSAEGACAAYYNYGRHLVSIAAEA
uniref:Hydrogenase expression/formation protein HypD n=1 Tax=Solibacter usitatus (strain Ellin6076) TaxID=234267 RepID=Q01S96_SOLUE